MAISLLVLALYEHTHLVWLGLIFFSGGFGDSFFQIMYAHIKERMPSYIPGTAMTGVNFLL